jgi:DNA-binding PadR family transcriptional regulator
MRRKQGKLVPLEETILGIIQVLENQGVKKIYGFEIAKRTDSKTKLCQRGTIYRALIRLEKMGYLKSSWGKAIGNFPRRRYYHLINKE